jgi:hypothetical protein
MAKLLIEGVEKSSAAQQMGRSNAVLRENTRPK